MSKKEAAEMITDVNSNKNFTPLLSLHQKEGGKLIPFAGWQMPVEYSGIIQEHRQVRKDAGLFDLSHMGEIQVSGKDALELLQKLATNDLSLLQEGQACYTVMCHEKGGILDDLIVYRLQGKLSNLDEYLLVVNASNTNKILRWIKDHISADKEVHIQDLTHETALLAVQGPNSQKFLQEFCPLDLNSIRYYYGTQTEVAKISCFLSRTGYTGEDGFELYFNPKFAEQLWTTLRKKGVPPIGLGARDTLRLEAGYLLYGNDISEEISPLTAGLSWVVKFGKGDFIGKQSLLKQKEEGISQKLIAFTMGNRSIPRKGYRLFLNSEKIGITTSGTFSPTLEKGIGLGIVEFSQMKEDPFKTGMKIEVEIRGEKHPALICKKPFIKGSVKYGS